jgi:hypothetical protein
MSDKPPAIPVLTDVCKWCLWCAYGSCYSGHWQMRMAEYQEQLARWKQAHPEGKTEEVVAPLAKGEPTTPEPATRGRKVTSVPIPSLIHEYLRSIGRRGGSSRSPKKRAASARNGHLAGQRRSA